MHITKTQKNRGRIFLLFKYFLDNLFLTVFVQNVISKFVKVLPQKLSNSLLENSWNAFVQRSVRTACAKFKVDHLKSLSVHHTEIFYQRNCSNHENCNCKYLETHFLIKLPSLKFHFQIYISFCVGSKYLGSIRVFPFARSICQWNEIKKNRQ